MWHGNADFLKRSYWYLSGFMCFNSFYWKLNEKILPKTLGKFYPKILENFPSAKQCPVPTE